MAVFEKPTEPQQSHYLASSAAVRVHPIQQSPLGNCRARPAGRCRRRTATPEGDLYTRGAFLFVGYVQGRRFTEQYFTPDGWFATGDRAVMDAMGFIRITGRSKDIIIRGGENIPVKEIEDLLMRHPQVRGVVLVGLPDPRLGEIACACVIPESGELLTLEQVRAFLSNERVTRSFWPERVECMDEFPMTPSGKVQKFRLREILAARPRIGAAWR